MLPAIAVGCGRGTAAGGRPPPFRGHSSHFVSYREPAPAPPLPFRVAIGAERELAAYRGRTVLLNFWASWCGPCIHEMPALDRLAGHMDAGDLAVLPVSLDDSLPAVTGFYERAGLRHLPVVLGPPWRGSMVGGGAGGFPLYGLPMSYLIDRNGLLRGYLVGAADWDSPAALRLLRLAARAEPGQARRHISSQLVDDRMRYRRKIP